MAIQWTDKKVAASLAEASADLHCPDLRFLVQAHRAEQPGSGTGWALRQGHAGTGRTVGVPRTEVRPDPERVAELGLLSGRIAASVV